MDESSNLHVQVRVRPLNQREIDQGSQAAWLIDDDCMYNVLSSGKRCNEFTFDNVFAPDLTTQDVYGTVASEIIEEMMLKSYNATVFAYGQTSSGKTFTMCGAEACQNGLIHLAVQHMWRMAETSTEWEYSFSVSYLEIYNEHERDLLDISNSKVSLITTLSGVTCRGLTSVPITQCSQFWDCLNKGKAAKEIGSTAMNELSSRSHTIFQVQIESWKRGTSKSDYLRAATLNLVDLAGSERQKDSNTEGKRKLEGSMINKSLHTLQKVIKALAECKGDRSKAAHIPFRESKLTRMLENSLGGNAKTLVLCTVTPADFHKGETVSTLHFAQLAKMIQNKPKANVKISDKILIQQYQSDIEALKSKLQNLQDMQFIDPTAAKKDKMENQKNLLKVKNLEKMLKTYSSRFLQLKENVTGLKPRRQSENSEWLNGESFFALKDQKILSNQSLFRSEIMVSKDGRRFSCPPVVTSQVSQKMDDDGHQTSKKRTRDSLQQQVSTLKSEVHQKQKENIDLMQANADLESQLNAERLEFLEVLTEEKEAIQCAMQENFIPCEDSFPAILNNLKLSFRLQ